MQMFPDDDAAEAWLASIRWPDGPRCPYCDSYNVLAGAAHKTMLYRCRAKDCRKRFSVRIGTVLQDSKLGYQAWALAICLMTTELNRSSMKLHRDLGITQKSAWHLAHRIREAWDIVTESMVGPVEVDDTYIGGKERNKHAHKKLHAGRGPVGKAAVVGARNRATGQVAAKVVPNTQAGTLQGFVEGKRVPNAPVYTDGATAYDGLAGREAVHHSVGEYVRGQVHTNGMESFWSMLKRGYHGTYRLMSVKHLQRYVNEFAGRHNVRDLDTLDQMVAIVVGLVGKRLRYADLISGTRGVAT
ncbi:IS1595 family transposase [Candidatus Spongiisocius sp.]|uniref:IS1595 family transposase n=1 Tax=Candidatus Spongiisocius sp. TaxID=3101273 RepID=UPI003B5A43E1